MIDVVSFRVRLKDTFTAVLYDWNLDQSQRLVIKTFPSTFPFRLSSETQASYRDGWPSRPIKARY